MAEPSGLRVYKKRAVCHKSFLPCKLIISILKDTYQSMFYVKNGINQTFPNSGI